MGLEANQAKKGCNNHQNAYEWVWKKASISQVIASVGTFKDQIKC